MEFERNPINNPEISFCNDTTKVSLLGKCLRKVEKKAVRNGDLPSAFAARVLYSVVNSEKEKNKNFASDFASHLYSGKSAVSFFAEHPVLMDSDIRDSIVENLDFNGAMELVGKLNLFQIKSKEPKRRGRPPKKVPAEIAVKTDTKPLFTNLEDVKSLYPIVKKLFDKEPNKWVSKKGKECIDAKTLCSLFEKKNPSDDEKKNVTAIYLTVVSATGVLNMFFAENPKYSRKEIIKMDGSKFLFFPKELVSDFLVFIANKTLSSHRLQIKINESSDFKFPESIYEDKVVKPRTKQGVVITEKVEDSSEVLAWTSDKLKNFFDSDAGKELIIKIQTKTEYSSRHFHIIKEYKAADRLLYTNPSDYYWTPEDRSIPPVMRTPLANLTRLFFVSSGPKKFLNSKEQEDFIKSNVNPLWRLIYKKDIGGRVDGLPGIFLSKEEYVNAIYLLSNILKDKDLNPMNIGITKEYIKPVRPRYDLVY